MARATFQVGDLTAVIGDNGAEGDHRAGYSGIWGLHHASGGRSIFTTDSGGLNLEHIFDGHTDDHPAEVFFEPRHAPMEGRQLSESAFELHQPPTPTFKLESWTRFELLAPHYIDMAFRCVAREPTFLGGYIGLFWASYINAPEDKSMYFLGGPEWPADSWTQLCTQWHYDQSTVRSRGDRIELTFREQNRSSLFRSLSDLRYDLPLFYGHFDDHVWMVMFDRSEGIRLAHSPSGGGFNRARRTTNPAWDFQFLIPDYEVGTEYGFRARCVFRPLCPREALLEEYSRWAARVTRGRCVLPCRAVETAPSGRPRAQEAQVFGARRFIARGAGLARTCREGEQRAAPNSAVHAAGLKRGVPSGATDAGSSGRSGPRAG